MIIKFIIIILILNFSNQDAILVLFSFQPLLSGTQAFIRAFNLWSWLFIDTFIRCWKAASRLLPLAINWLYFISFILTICCCCCCCILSYTFIIESILRLPRTQLIDNLVIVIKLRFFIIFFLALKLLFSFKSCRICTPLTTNFPLNQFLLLNLMASKAFGIKNLKQKFTRLIKSNSIGSIVLYS